MRTFNKHKKIAAPIRILEQKELKKRSDELSRREGLLHQREQEFAIKEKLIDNLLHDTRQINSNLVDSIDRIDFENASPNILRIWAQANLLSIRQRLYDFEINPDMLEKVDKLNFPVHKRFSKVFKCLKYESLKKKLWIDNDKGTFLKFYAHDILEIAFYIIAENAIKYAVPGSHINVKYDEAGSDLTVVVTNKCECLPLENELDKLFERGYRGMNASEKGTGIGMYTLKKILDHQGVPIKVNNIHNPDNKSGSFSVCLTFKDCVD